MGLKTVLRGVGAVLLVLCISMPVCAQNSKKVKNLKAQKTQLQKNLKKNQQALVKTGKDVKDGQSYLHHIDRQLEDRVEHIRTMEHEMDSIETEMKHVRANIVSLDAQLADKKQKYLRAIRFSRQFPKVRNTLVFVLSAKSLTQMYRRARYTREYAVYQHDLGRQIQQKQGELMEAQNSLLASKSRMAGLLQEVIRQRRKLNEQQVRQQQYIKNLKRREDNLRDKVSKQQRELSALNKKIDDLIAYEIEQARKRAEAEARRKAEAEAKRRAAAKKQAKTGTSTSKKPASSEGTASKSTKPASSSSGSWLTASDKKLNGTFLQNKGRLPVPITGQYRISGRFGRYNVPGLKNVTLDNKGVNYVGKPGARARCIFDGEVTAVFQFSGSKNVLVRHGSYISVYCNLSSVIVRKGQKLRARDLIGTVQADESGNCILHFQLRKETTKLNPEAWIGR
ncbi:MAG: peptidoglycan DD-metalloendopeptidase family protein [Bacteroidaceae bacterium]|nr:peptidoglycan DD-metalloendopeptidase family protein [Bacteroidaceae bacterium]